MHARHVPVYLVLLGVLNTVYAGFDEGFSAFQRGDFTAALREWRPLAEQGNAAAQSNLGMMYVQGKGVPQDFKEAIKWYRLAAEQGQPSLDPTSECYTPMVMGCRRITW